MWDPSQVGARKSGCEITHPSGARPKSRTLSSRKSNADVPGKKTKSVSHQQTRTDRGYPCTCIEDLEVIEEEHDQCEDQCTPHEETSQKSLRAHSGESMSPQEPTGSGADTSQAPGEDDPCGEFFDIMRETMESAVKKTLDSCFNQHFTSLFEKMEALSERMERSECVIAKVYADLCDKITFYGERSVQQFQYLCVRMEHDRLFYQQQQEFFLKAVAKCPQGSEFLRRQQCGLDNAAGSMSGCQGKTTAKCGIGDEHTKGKENAQPMDAMGQSNSSHSREEQNDRELEKSAGRAKSRAGADIGQRRSESAGPAVGGEQATGRSTKRK